MRQALTAPPPTTPGRRYAWYVVFVLLLCYTLSFIDRQILSLLVRPIKQDLGISDTRIGLLQGLAFALFYGVCGLPIGRLADRASRRNIIAAGILLWSLFTASCAAALSFWTLFVARMGVGVGEASLQPSALSLIADYFPRERLGTALGVYSMGVFVGSGSALLVGGLVIDAVTRFPSLTLPLLGAIAPWRFTFVVVGAPGVLVALLLYTVREPVRRDLLRRADGVAPHLSVRDVATELRRRWQSIAGITIGMIGQSTGTYGFVAWAPTFLMRVHGWTPSEAGRTLGLIVLTTGCLGMSFGGWLCDRWQPRGADAPLRVGVVGGVGTGVFFALATLAPSPAWTVAAMAPALFFLSMPVGSSFAGLQMIFPNQVRGQATALFAVVLNLGGLTLGPLLPGVFNDYVFHDERMLGASLALTMGLAAVLMMVSYRATYGCYRRHFAIMQGGNW